MPHRLSRRWLIAGALCACAAPLSAAPRRYRLVDDRSSVAFQFSLNGAPQTGTVPVQSADIRVNTSNLARSTADVTADIRGARTGFLFITQALLSPSVLDADTHPLVRFRSTRVRLGPEGRLSGGARIEGALTLRGVTRPLVLEAALTRPAGTAPDDLSTLFIDLAGVLDRRDYGATGYPDLVAPEVTLEIRAEIRAET